MAALELTEQVKTTRRWIITSEEILSMIKYTSYYSGLAVRGRSSSAPYTRLTALCPGLPR